MSSLERVTCTKDLDLNILLQYKSGVASVCVFNPPLCLLPLTSRSQLEHKGVSTPIECNPYSSPFILYIIFIVSVEAEWENESAVRGDIDPALQQLA